MHRFFLFFENRQEIKYNISTKRGFNEECFAPYHYCRYLFRL